MSLASRIKKFRDTAIELGSKDTFFKTWNSLLTNIGSLNIQIDQQILLTFQRITVTLKNRNYPVITNGNTLGLIYLRNVKIEYFIFLTMTFNYHSLSDCKLKKNSLK